MLADELTKHPNKTNIADVVGKKNATLVAAGLVAVPTIESCL